MCQISENVEVNPKIGEVDDFVTSIYQHVQLLGGTSDEWWISLKINGEKHSFILWFFSPQTHKWKSLLQLSQVYKHPPLDWLGSSLVERVSTISMVLSPLLRENFKNKTFVLQTKSWITRSTQGWKFKSSTSHFFLRLHIHQNDGFCFYYLLCFLQ